MDKDDALKAIEDLKRFVSSSGVSWHKKGYEFEKLFVDLCFERGIECKRVGRGHYDFIANGLRIQAKALTPDQSGDVYVQPGSGPYYPRNSFDVLAVKIPSGVCLIPEADISSTKSGFLKATLNVSFLNRYLNAWWVIQSGRRPIGFFPQKLLPGVFAQTRPVNDGR